jgi:hypothetical protein
VGDLAVGSKASSFLAFEAIPSDKDNVDWSVSAAFGGGALGRSFFLLFNAPPLTRPFAEPAGISATDCGPRL